MLEGRLLLDGVAIDTGFGNEGVASTLINVAPREFAPSLAVTPTNKILSVSINSTSTYFTTLSQFDVGGTLDVTFGEGGRKTLPGAGSTVLRVDELGRLLALRGSPPRVERYSSAGVGDPSFATNISVTGNGTDLKLQGEFAVALVGNFVVKLDSSGQLVDAFGGGQVDTNVVAGVSFSARVLQPLPDGSVLVGGHVQNGSSFKPALRLFSATGALVSTFGTAGTLFAPAYGSSSSFSRLVPQSSTQILASLTNFGGGGTALFRLNLATGWDTAFNNGLGQFTPNTTAAGEAIVDVTLDTQGRPIGIASTTNSPSRTEVFRLTPSGALDGSFGSAGYQTDALPVSSDQTAAASSVVYLPNANAVLLGAGIHSQPTYADRGFLYSFLANGVPNPYFGSGGRVAVGGVALPSSVNITARRALPDGTTFIATRAQGDIDVAHLTKFTPAGTLGEFGLDGTTTVNFGGYSSVIYDIALTPDGKIVVAGSKQGLNAANQNFEDDFTLARFNADGTLDATFGNAGTAIVGFPGGTSEAFTCLDIADDGTIYAAGSALYYDQQPSCVCHFSADGVLDTQFGNGGALRLESLFPANTHVSPWHIQADGGTLFISGTAFSLNSFASSGFAARLLMNGTADTTFGSEGIYRFSQATSGRASNSLAIDAKNRRYTLLTQSNYANPELRRFTFDGVPDTTFGSAGLVTVTLNTRESIREFSLMPDGTLLLAGSSSLATPTAQNSSDLLFIRLTSAGTLDGTFGTNGRQTLDVSSADACNGLFLTDSGKLTVITTINPSDNLVRPAAVRLNRIDTTAPKIVSTLADYEQERQIVVQFSDSVLESLTKSDVELRRIDGNSFVNVAADDFSLTAWDLMTNTRATVGLSPILPDGNYVVNVISGSVADPAGNVTTADLPSSPVFFFAADANRDRTVDTRDFAALIAGFGQANRTFSQGNFNYDTAVNSVDFNIFVGQYGKTLAAPAPAALPAAAKAATATAFGRVAVGDENDKWPPIV